jgi:death-on-curing protein
VSEPSFLEFEQILILHERSLRAYGGSGGIRDEGLIRSAVFQPRNDYYYAGADLFGIAAAYAFHLAQAQAFLDGNKRTAIAAAITFLE